MLLRIYQDLKFLGHPKYQAFEKRYQTSIVTVVGENVLKDEVSIDNCTHMRAITKH